MGNIYNITKGHTLVFDARESTDNVGIESYQWTLRYDDEKLFGEMVEFTFNRTGTYNITLNVTDTEGNRKSLTFPVNVIEGMGESADEIRVSNLGIIAVSPVVLLILSFLLFTFLIVKKRRREVLLTEDVYDRAEEVIVVGYRCHECGKSVDEDDLICPGCGMEFEKEMAVEEEENGEGDGESVEAREVGEKEVGNEEDEKSRERADGSKEVGEKEDGDEEDKKSRERADGSKEVGEKEDGDEEDKKSRERAGGSKEVREKDGGDEENRKYGKRAGGSREVGEKDGGDEEDRKYGERSGGSGGEGEKDDEAEEEGKDEERQGGSVETVEDKDDEATEKEEEDGIGAEPGEESKEINEGEEIFNPKGNRGGDEEYVPKEERTMKDIEKLITDWMNWEPSDY